MKAINKQLPEWGVLLHGIYLYKANYRNTRTRCEMFQV